MGVRLDTADDGEVLARANVVFDGYWRQPDATAEAMAGGWFHTGDGGHIDADGYVTISDRKKDVIISGGENISSIEVEECLYQHPAVAEAAVIGVPDERWGETVKAIVVLRPGAGVGEADLIAHCRERLAHFKCPDQRRAPRRAGPHRDRQDPEVQAAGAVLGRAEPDGQLTVVAAGGGPADGGAAARIS